MNLFQELKRRKVFKTVGVYAAASLIIIQVADIVFPRLLLPDWTVTFVIVLVIIGFPITFFLSWNYDIKPDSKLDSGEINPEETTHPEANQTEKSNLNIYTITGGALAVIGIMFWFFFSTSSLSTADEGLIENSIAVFSFDNLSTGEETSRMGEILQHLIISDLSGLAHLKVISHQRLQDIQKQNSGDIENYTIAQQANAKVLLSGSIMDLSGKKILVGELIDAIDGNVITSHRIEGEDIYLMVDELTDNIHKDLDISKHSEDYIELQAGTKTTQSLDAYEKYLEGLSYLNDLDYEKANNNFQDAVKIDSTFFDAHYLSAIAMWWMDESETNQDASEYCKQLIDNKIYNDDIQKLEAEGAYLDAVYYCPHLPEAKIEKYALECDCRKPATGLVEQAYQDNKNLNRALSFVVGDKATDVELAKNCGARGILVETGYGKRVQAGDYQWPVEPDFQARSIAEAVDWIIQVVNENTSDVDKNLD